MFYRLYDTQTGCCMATGYNAKSKKELKDSYISYKSNDLDDEDEKMLKNASAKDVMSLIEADEFVIEKSKKRFPEADDPTLWSD